MKTKIINLTLSLAFFGIPTKSDAMMSELLNPRSLSILGSRHGMQVIAPASSISQFSRTYSTAKSSVPLVRIENNKGAQVQESSTQAANKKETRPSDKPNDGCGLDTTTTVVIAPSSSHSSSSSYSGRSYGHSSYHGSHHDDHHDDHDD